MTKKITILLSWLTCAISVTYADYHAFGGKLALGYENGLTPNINRQYGIGTTADLVYEFNRGHFLFQIGAGLNFGYNRTTMNDQMGYLYNMIDDDGSNCIYGYRITNRLENANLLRVEVPLMIGGKWDAIYFLVGCKVQSCVYGTFKEKASLQTWGEYNNLITPLRDMPNHGFYTDVHLFDQQKFKFPIEIMASTEIGLDITSIGTFVPSTSRFFICRLALYAECDLNRLQQPKQETLLDWHLNSNQIHDINVSAISMQHHYFATDFSNSSLRFFSIGLRCTLLLASPFLRNSCHCNRY